MVPSLLFQMREIKDLLTKSNKALDILVTSLVVLTLRWARCRKNRNPYRDWERRRNRKRCRDRERRRINVRELFNWIIWWSSSIFTFSAALIGDMFIKDLVDLKTNFRISKNWINAAIQLIRKVVRKVSLNANAAMQQQISYVFAHIVSFQRYRVGSYLIFLILSYLILS